MRAPWSRTGDQTPSQAGRPDAEEAGQGPDSAPQPTGEASECEFADYPGVTQDDSFLEQLRQGRATDPKVAKPHGRVDEGHEVSPRTT